MDKEIIRAYKQLKSVKMVARALGVSVVKVRRTLITAGLWRSKRGDAYLDLLHKGLTPDEIAKKHGVSPKAVEAYMPYTHGSYGGTDKSYTALVSDLYRKRKRYALSRQISRSYSDNTETERKGCRKYMENSNECKALHLHLELDLGGLSKPQLTILEKCGNVKEGISRDVIVPSSITLHALHYLIQQLFGWQNSHLHHFALPQEAFTMLTDGKFANWKKLCGIYFQMPNTKDPNRFWDDDYDGKVSFRSWLSSKYNGPYQYDTEYELYSSCQQQLDEHFEENLPPLPHFRNAGGNAVLMIPTPEQATIMDAHRYYCFDGDIEALLERLTLAQILLSDNEKTPSTIAEVLTDPIPITKALHYYYDYGDGWEVSINLVENSEEVLKHTDVAITQKPTCINVDGLDVMDDVGGVPGYCSFLHDIHFNEPSQTANLWESAILKGWSNQQRKPENIL